MLHRLRFHVRHNVVGYLALFFALSGTAVGANAALKVGDPAGGDLTGNYPDPSIRANAVDTGKVSNDSLTGTDINEGTLSGVSPSGAAGGDLTGTYPNPTIAAGAVTGGSGGKIADDSITGADVDESTLSSTVRAYARVISPAFHPCTGGASGNECGFDHSKGVTRVTNPAGLTGTYCVTAPGISPESVPAVATVDLDTTSSTANASAMISGSSRCLSDTPGGTDAFVVRTLRQPLVTVDAGGGTNNASVAGNATVANDVGFIIMIP
jgi:hypothetical protein